MTRAVILDLELVVRSQKGKGPDKDILLAASILNSGRRGYS